MLLRTFAVTVFLFSAINAEAGEILFPSKARLGEVVGIGIDIDDVSPNGSLSARKNTIFLVDTSKAEEQGSDSSFRMKVFQGKSDYTRTTVSGASASATYYVSVAASFNKQTTETRSNENLYATVFSQTITKHTILNKNLEAIKKLDLVEGVRDLIDQAAKARATSNYAELASIQREFADYYGTGLLREIQSGALYSFDYSQSIASTKSVKDVTKSVSAGFELAKAKKTGKDKTENSISTSMLNQSGNYIGHHSTGIESAMTFDEALAVLANRDTKSAYSKKVAENPKPVRFRYTGYEEIPILRGLVDPRRAMRRDIATDLFPFGDQVPDSHGFVAFQEGWSDTSFGTIPKLVVSKIDLASDGFLGVTYAVERSMIGDCVPDANLSSPDALEVGLCADSKVKSGYPHRISRWRERRDDIVASFSKAAQEINDPVVLWESELIPTLLVEDPGIDDVASLPMLFDASDQSGDAITVGTIVNQINAGGGGVRYSYRLDGSTGLKQVVDAFAGGKVVIQTIAQTPAGVPVAFPPISIGTVQLMVGESVVLEEYLAVHSDEMDGLVEMLNGQNIDHESTKIRLYESGCSQGAIEVGKEYCRKRIMLHNGQIDGYCRVHGTQFLNTSIGNPGSTWDQHGCIRHAACIHGAFMRSAGQYPTRAEFTMYHRPILDLTGGYGNYIAEFSCTNKPTDRFVVETPLPKIVRPTMEGVVTPAVAQ